MQERRFAAEKISFHCRTTEQQTNDIVCLVRPRIRTFMNRKRTGSKVIGDAAAPGPIAWATYAGHRYARELDMADIGDALPFRREVVALQN